jgi:hypothetical protein
METKHSLGGSAKSDVNDAGNPPTIYWPAPICGGAGGSVLAAFAFASSGFTGS